MPKSNVILGLWTPAPLDFNQSKGQKITPLSFGECSPLNPISVGPKGHVYKPPKGQTWNPGAPPKQEKKTYRWMSGGTFNLVIRLSIPRNLCLLASP